MASDRKSDSSGVIARNGLLIVLGVAVLMRVVYIIQYHGMPDWAQLTVDANYHHHWAQDIAAGNVFGDTTYFRAPLYAWVLGLVYAIFGDSIWVGRILGVLIGIGSVGMTYVLGRRLFGGEAGQGDRARLGVWAGFFAGMIHAVFMMAVYFEPEHLVDPLYTLLVIVMLDRFVVWYRSGGAREALVFAVWLGLAAITRPNALVMVPVALAALWVRQKEEKNQASERTSPPRDVRLVWMQMAALVLGLAVTIGPVTVRNLVVAGDATMIASSGGINLYIGNNPEADGVSAVLPPPLGANWRIEQTVMHAEQASGRRLSPGEVGEYWSGRAVEWMMENPGRFISLYLTKLRLFFANTLVSNNRELYQFVERVPVLGYNPVRFAPVFGLAVLGLIIGAWGARPMRWLVVFVGLSVVSGAGFFFATRFALPLWPVYFVAAGYGVAQIGRVWQEQKRRAVIAVAAGVVAAGVAYAMPGVGDEKVSVHALMEEGTWHYSNGDPGRALRVWQEAKRVDPSFEGVRTNIGAALLRTGQADSAIASFREEIGVNPWYGRAWTNLAYAYLTKGNREEAVQAAREGIAREPYAYSPNMALLHALFGDSTMADQVLLAEVLAAADRTGGDVYLLVEAGNLFLEREAMGAAAKCYGRALESEGPAIEMDHEGFRAEYRNSEVNVRRQQAAAAIQWSYIEGSMGRADEAIRMSRRAVELAPEMPEAYMNLAGGLRITGKEAEADSVLKEASRRFPGNTDVRGMMQGR